MLSMGDQGGKKIGHFVPEALSDMDMILMRGERVLDSRSLLAPTSFLLSLSLCGRSALVLPLR